LVGYVMLIQECKVSLEALKSGNESAGVSLKTIKVDFRQML